jgi:thiamine transport system permease protein
VDRDRPGLIRSHRHPNRLPRWFVAALAATPAAFLVVFYVTPFVTLLANGVAFDDLGVLGRRRTWEVVWFTTWQATVSTALTLIVGIAPSYVLARFRFAGRRLLLGLLTAAFVLPTVVMGAAFSALLPDSLDRSIWAILCAHVVFNLAVVVRTVGAVWEHLPPDLEAAAATLGASPWRVLREVTLPLLRPALTAAGSIVFLFTFTSFGVIRILGTAARPTLEVEIWRRATQLGEIGPAAVLAVIQLIALGVVVGWSTYSQRRHSLAIAMRPSATLIGPRRARRRRERILVGLTAITTAAMVTIPLLALVERSMRSDDGYSLRAWRRLGDAEVRRGISVSVDPLGSLGRSVQTAAWATALAVGIGAVAALAIVAAGRLSRTLDTGLMLPIGTSAVTIGFGMLITFDTPPIDWRAEWWLVPVGHALVAVPFVVRATLGVLRALDPALTDAAATLGASPKRAWREITLPHLWRPLVAGAGLAAAISLGEFGATSFISRSGQETMPLAIERLLGRTGTVLHAQGYALAVILAVTTIAIVFAVDITGDIAGGAAGHRDHRGHRAKGARAPSR